MSSQNIAGKVDGVQFGGNGRVATQGGKQREELTCLVYGYTFIQQTDSRMVPVLANADESGFCLQVEVPGRVLSDVCFEEKARSHHLLEDEVKHLRR